MSMGASLARVVSGVREEGILGFARRGSRRLSIALGDRLNWDELDFPLREEDVADSSDLRASEACLPASEDPLHIGWVCTPPGAGSGGHTTLFRMVQSLEQRGHRCTLLLYDRNSDSVERHEPVIRRCWPDLRAEVRSATAGMDDFDAVVASSWATAHVVASRAPRSVHRLYFIQDFEPYFYPRGALYALAEDTYRFGFTNIALGRMVADMMVREAGVQPEFVVPFGCDTDVYRLLPATPGSTRSGVVFYAKKGNDRRGYLLAKLAMEKFHCVHPEQEIHVYGDHVSDWKIPVTNHGSLRPSELNELYNRTIAGVAMSFTNISLVAEELLAAGNIAVVNDSVLARADLASGAAAWAPPTPQGIADALSAVVEGPDPELRSLQAASSTRRTWGDTKNQVAAVIESVCRTASLEDLVS